ncbi:hypothetical protein BD289DRAFT_358216 [Coniella lustricola]|uniref:WD40-repeat-containing domain protein n=1 Tax=Coniella lustricola TaxID=2025994 RepID=A0A2T3AN93_9PEZI|nr:hypothetical protein BD289DRAFT_358216 [Coniella lustricola]
MLEKQAIHAIVKYPTDTRDTRLYEGPLRDWLRGLGLLKILYGPDPDHVQIAWGMLKKWFNHQILPNRGPGESGVMESPWLAEDYEDKQRHWSRSWYDRYRAARSRTQRLRKIRSEHIALFQPAMTELACLIGPFDRQQQLRTQYGIAQATLETGELWQAAEAAPEASSSRSSPKGWVLDAGGIPLAMEWAPLAGHAEQFLAVATIPFSDQDPKDADSIEPDPEEFKKGTLQVWSLPLHREEGIQAHLVQALSFDWGRPKRLQWCPVPLPDDSKLGLLAVLCGDGQVRILEVSKPLSAATSYDWVVSPAATLGITNEYAVHTTSFTWVNINRICLGHSDGSITLWSIHPLQLITRRPVHTSHIVDIASGFPSHPYHIATTPVGGCPTLTDLNLPSAETTFTLEPNSVNFQPNLLDWNDHLQGYVGLHPSPLPHNTVIGFTHVRHFVQSHMLMTTSSMPMCLATGRSHPFTLVGCADGSLWAFNPLRVLLKDRYDEVHKLKVLQHDFRPASAIKAQQQIRGAARILQGFRLEYNSNLSIDLVVARNKKAIPSNSKRPKPKITKRKKPVGHKDDGGIAPGDSGVLRVDEELLLIREAEKTKAVVHEPLTRVTVVAWNPNVEYGWWGAAAMGSGLIKVMDLGLHEWGVGDDA